MSLTENSLRQRFSWENFQQYNASAPGDLGNVRGCERVGLLTERVNQNGWNYLEVARGGW
jgi:hypothetical protein